MNAPGTHLLIEGYYPEGALQALDLEAWRGLLRQIAGALRLEVLGEAAHDFGQPPGAVTVILLLSTSHASVHTWPERGYVAIDVFTCGEELAATQIELVMALLRRTAPRTLDLRVIDRG